RRLRSSAPDRARNLRQAASKRTPCAVAAEVAAPFIARCVHASAKLASAAEAGIRKLLAELVEPGLHGLRLRPRQIEGEPAAVHTVDDPRRLLEPLVVQLQSRKRHR